MSFDERSIYMEHPAIVIDATKFHLFDLSTRIIHPDKAFLLFQFPPIFYCLSGNAYRLFQPRDRTFVARATVIGQGRIAKSFYQTGIAGPRVKPSPAYTYPCGASMRFDLRATKDGYHVFDRRISR